VSIEGEEARLEARDRGLTVDGLVNRFCQCSQGSSYLPSGFFLGLAVLAISARCILASVTMADKYPENQVVDCLAHDHRV